VGRAEHVQRHLADVPRRAIGGPRPFVLGERGREIGETPELLLGEHSCFGPSDPGWHHGCVLLRFASSRYMSVKRSRWRIRRSPPANIASNSAFFESK